MQRTAGLASAMRCELCDTSWSALVCEYSQHLPFPTVSCAKIDFQIKISKFGWCPHFQGMCAVNEAVSAEGRSAVWVRSKTSFKVFLFINQGETFI